MANVLPKDKQIAVIAALTEGSSLRSIERITGIHHDTIGRLAVKVGQGCAALLDSSMRNLPCNRLEMDEIWGFVGKKDRNVREGEDGVGSVWTFCAIDAETKEEDGSHYPACPICGGLKPNSSFEKGYFLYKGHKKSCWLGQALS
jgi:hypothetical protein